MDMKSIEKLRHCDERLVRLVATVDEYIPIKVVYTHRGKEEQDKLFAEGKSKLPFPKSKHNAYPSLAVDIVPEKTLYNDAKSMFYIAGIMVALAKTQCVNIRWGGNWDMDNDLSDNSFNDLAHFELK